MSDSRVTELERLVVRQQRLSERFPSTYPLAVLYNRGRRRIRWITSRTTWARTQTEELLPVRVKAHKSLLRRDLGPEETGLQDGKVQNLRLSAARVDGLLIRPGETFSFNRVVGNCTRGKGYVEGMRLSNGEARAGVGGGICQLANLLHWMVLHSPLTVTERSEHSFDPFPDNGRVLPWGSGCSIVYNYVDLCVRNDTDLTFCLTAGVGERYLAGELRADGTPRYSYKVYAKDEEFVRLGAEYFRRNELWRNRIDRTTGQIVGNERIRRNVALVKYLPSGVPIRDITPVATSVVVDPRRVSPRDRSGVLPPRPLHQ